MVKTPANRSLFTRVVCVLSMALLCAMGVAQAVHSHPDDSTTSHHVCPICSTAQAGLSMQAPVIAPVMAATVLASPAQEHAGIFRPATTQFIRPPPAF